MDPVMSYDPQQVRISLRFLHNKYEQKEMLSFQIMFCTDWQTDEQW